MAQEVPETTYEPEVEEDARRKREHRVVQEGTVLWRRRKEELQRQKHREQREVCVTQMGVSGMATLLPFIPLALRSRPPLNVIVSPRYCYRSDKGLLREIRPRDMFGEPERH
ncbi:hypothetical protein ALC60_14715 [Trachymyrmex zeteki]|uniref:Uncharacterized protein n=1 Tax=Mycetomoellerius zeteki TaxID=64791 RepID=A0A151WEM7_9HYME|nr:hypothetical protein ALC60_14715 [Trachymyrmex zeteki]